MRLFASVFALMLIAFAPGAAAAGYSDWAAIVAGGDYRAHSLAPSEVFDNARRDVVARLVKLGFDPDHILQYSSSPTADYGPDLTPAGTIALTDGLQDLSRRAPGGCFFYLTSHGGPEGALVRNEVLTPGILSLMLGRSCRDRPIIAIISACYSGVFVPALEGPNTMVLTAARPDRASFGCGETDTYTYFDGCILESWDSAADFPDLGKRAQACVAAREKRENAKPASEPQLFVGPKIAPLLAADAFTKPSLICARPEAPQGTCAPKP